MNSRIKYISHYGCREPERYRGNSPASDNKKDYIFSVLNRIGYGVDHISRASSGMPHKFLPAYVEKKGDNTFRYFASFGKSSNRILSHLNMWFVHVQFFLWLLLNLKRGETVIVYHSLGYDMTFVLLKKIKQIQIIGEVEELYQDVHKFSKRVCRNEYRFIEICDFYIFPNIILNERLNSLNKRYVIIHGIYRIQKERTLHNTTDCIHVLYSGTFDPVKGGAIAAVQMTEFLSEKYVVHITGFGSPQYEQMLKDEIKLIRPKTKAQIVFHGFMSDSEYTQLIKKCSLGLCTQNPETELNNTSFPSKILFYLSYGMTVLVGKNRAIEQSMVGDIVHYYKQHNPKSISDAVKLIGNDSNEYDRIIDRIIELDKQFANDVLSLLA